MYNIDQNVINKLLSFCNIGAFGPGALLFNHTPDSKSKQLDCIANIFEHISPKYVLETGTESGMFCYFAKCLVPNIKVVTFGMNAGCNTSGDERSLKCTNFLNEYFGSYIEYIEGDSTITLTEFKTDKVIDFAWIDGGHVRSVLMKDLENCLRLNINHICIDDYNMITEVRNTVEEFLSVNSIYKKRYVTEEERGICYINKV